MQLTEAEHLARVLEIARSVAHADAEAVDRESRFPARTLIGLKDARVLSAAVPRELGGSGAGVIELMKACHLLGQHCSSSAMVLAMHHIQVASIAKHCGKSPEWRSYLERLVSEQRLIASVTSEAGIGGDLRRSQAAVVKEGDACSFTKKATTISYGQYADDLLITLRRDSSADPGDQVLVLACKEQFALNDSGSWDTLGMRGTCSPGATVTAQIKPWQVLGEPFSEIATQTMVPYSHLLWAACWLGIGTDVVNRVRALVRARARSLLKKGEVGPEGLVPSSVAGATGLAQLVTKLDTMERMIFGVANDYVELEGKGDRAKLQSIGFALAINNLKLAASEAVVDIATRALGAAGIEGYKNNGEFSLGRQLRDAHSAMLMINNQRLIETNATLLLIHRGE